MTHDVLVDPLFPWMVFQCQNLWSALAAYYYKRTDLMEPSRLGEMTDFLDWSACQFLASLRYIWGCGLKISEVQDLCNLPATGGSLPTTAYSQDRNVTDVHIRAAQFTVQVTQMVAWSFKPAEGAMWLAFVVTFKSTQLLQRLSAVHEEPGQHDWGSLLGIPR